MGRQHDLGVDEFFLLVVEFRFLVVLAEQPFAALVAAPATADCPWLRFTMVILKCGHEIGITPKQKTAQQDSSC